MRGPSLGWRRLVGAVLVCLACSSGAWATATREVADLGLSGLVKDVFGNAVDDVEVLLVGPPAVVPLAVAHSNSAGLFNIPDVSPGVYRIAGIKEGYRTFVGSVNTRVRSWVELVLQPVPVVRDGELLPLPQDSTWALRLPERSVLREVEASVPAEAVEDRPEGDGSLSGPLNMQFEHVFALDAQLSDVEGPATDLVGSKTKLQLASALGERGHFLVQGSRERFEGMPAEENTASPPRREAASLRVGFSYDTGPDAQLELRAYFSQKDLEWGGGPPQDPATVREERRSWGYGARWIKQLDPDSSLALKLDYRDNLLQSPGGLTSKTSPADRAMASLINRSVGAGGSYQSLPAENHEIEVRFGARVLEGPWSVERSPVDAANPVFSTDFSGVSLGLEAQDTWSLSGPFALVYGLGYHSAAVAREASLIVPKFGGAWTNEDVALRFVLSYTAVADEADPTVRAAGRELRPAQEVGYEAEVEVPLGEGLQLTGATRYAPLHLDHIGRSTLQAYDEPSGSFYVTNGNAAVRQNRIVFVQDAGGARSFVELTAGRVEGSVAPLMFFETPLRSLADRRLDFRNGRVGLRLVSSGTDLLLEYLQLVESAAVPHTNGASVQKTIELRMEQDLLRFHSLGSWRLLMALRTASLEGSFSDLPGRSDLELAALRPAQHRISAGLSVLF